MIRTNERMSQNIIRFEIQIVYVGFVCHGPWAVKWWTKQDLRSIVVGAYIWVAFEKATYVRTLEHKCL